MAEIHDWLGRLLVAADGATLSEVKYWAKLSGRYSTQDVLSALKEMELKASTRGWIWFADVFSTAWDYDENKWIPPKPKVTTLYRFYGREGLLYIGISDRFPERISEHKKYSSWFELAEWVRLERYDSRKDAEAAERLAIIRERPTYNIQHNPP